MQFFCSYHMITLSSSPLGILTSLDQIFHPLAINTFALGGDEEELQVHRTRRRGKERTCRLHDDSEDEDDNTSDDKEGDSDDGARDESRRATASATANGKRKAPVELTSADAPPLVIRLLMNHRAKEATVLRAVPKSKRPKHA